ncbi:MAG: response regulator transcription factor [Lachnospiraceae bacterium]|nr:response regulator transcription factor [Lachnospiraceae bacterium]
MIKILIVEDDINIAKMIQTTIEMGGYEACVCNDGISGLEKINSNCFDLALLDVMLPGLDGFGIIGKKTSATPVIFITAKQDVMDKVSGLKLGAEDYIVKPFEAMELLARIEVVLRRYNKEDHILTYDDIVVDIREHSCKQKGALVSLTPKEFDILLFFLRHPDVAISRSQLLSSIWGYEFEGESRTVDIHIQQLRKKLGLKDKLITLPKLGYRLNRDIC